jgi:hypothetical protein
MTVWHGILLLQRADGRQQPSSEQSVPSSDMT